MHLLLKLIIVYHKLLRLTFHFSYLYMRIAASITIAIARLYIYMCMYSSIAIYNTQMPRLSSYAPRNSVCIVVVLIYA